ncbi:hypothetical protein THIX_60765 [Thiomonas sp. X19]|nr:hypothetical protein THIX_30813 [Thiomonas sp. X19]SCC93594.1 hypothetical protein THIX_30822 [Thiomonas sp. X19]SCC94707.1 hypothetical protein THIX_60765 [Thiomonas sp. X19]
MSGRTMQLYGEVPVTTRGKTKAGRACETLDPRLVARIPPVHLISLDPACIRMVHARNKDLTDDIDSRHILSHQPRTMFSHHRRTACDAAAMNSSP